MKKTDVVIVGAGAVGCAVARELSKYEISVIVVDQNEDVGGDASKSNSAIIHTGYDAAPGTLSPAGCGGQSNAMTRLRRIWMLPFASGIGAVLPASPKSSTSNCRGFKRRPSVTMCTM